MNITRLLALIRKEFIQIVRDPRTLTIIFIMPVLQLLLLGFSATNDVRNVPLVVLDEDRSPAARDLLAAYRAADYFHIDYDVTSESEMRKLIDDGPGRRRADHPTRLRRQNRERADGPGRLRRRWLRPFHRRHGPVRRATDRPGEGHLPWSSIGRRSSARAAQCARSSTCAPRCGTTPT